VDAGTPTPILHALFRTAFQGRRIGGRLLVRLLRPADPGRPIPARTGASADRRADTSWSWPMGGGFLACRAFGAAADY
jgi:hypothetical protein